MPDDFSPELKAVVERSIEALAGACDHAQARDNAGFSKATAGPGHEIAALGAERWTNAIWYYACRLSAHHAKQLERAGVLGEPDIAALHLYANLGVRAPLIHSNWMEIATVESRPTLVVSIRDNQNLAALLKQINKQAPTEVYQPAGGGKLWRVSSRFAFAVGEAAREFERLSDLVDQFIVASAENASAEDRLIAHDGPVMRLRDDGLAVVFVQPFNPSLRQLLDETGGGSWKIGNTWNDCTYEISLDANGYRLLQAIKDTFDVVIMGDAQTAMDAAKDIAPKTKADSVGLSLTQEGATVVLKASGYVKSWVEVIKQVPGRRYDNGAWIIPGTVSSLERLIAAARDIAEAAPIVERAEAIMPRIAAAEAVRPSSATAASYPTLNIIGHPEAPKVDLAMTAYVEPWVAAIKSLDPKARRWSGSAWTVQNDAKTFGALVEAFEAVESSSRVKDFGPAATETLRTYLGRLPEAQAAEPTSRR